MGRAGKVEVKGLGRDWERTGKGRTRKGWGISKLGLWFVKGKK